MWKVKVLVYDLSQGMASQMSEAILGQRIDGIWHTGILVFGYEYFFGGGIQYLPEGRFPAANGFQACRVHEVGETRVSKEDFHSYLRSIHHLYSQQTYNLITNNCNNFSDTICRYLTGTGIPSYIVDLPRTVFSTPGGMALRPMFENMQNSIQGGSGDPFGHMGTAVSNNSSNFPSYTSPASLASSSNATARGSEGMSSSTSLSSSSPSLSPWISSLSPLVSGDCEASIIENMCAKILNTTSSLNASSSVPLSTERTDLLTETEKQAIIEATGIIKNKPLPGICSPLAYNTLIRLLSDCPSIQLACLFLLRLMVLIPDKTCLPPSSTASFRGLLSMIVQPNNQLNGIPAIVMSLCTLSNLLTSSSGCDLIYEDDTLSSRLLDYVIMSLSHARVEMRQMSAAVILNMTIVCTNGKEGGGWRVPSPNSSALPVGRAGVREGSNEIPSEADNEEDMHPAAVQVICGTLEGVSDEIDAVCRQRRLASACRVLRSCGKVSVNLAKDIGFDVPVSDMLKRHNLTLEEKQILNDLHILFTK